MLQNESHREAKRMASKWIEFAESKKGEAVEKPWAEEALQEARVSPPGLLKTNLLIKKRSSSTIKSTRRTRKCLRRS